MKRVINFVLVLSFLFLLSGCDNNKTVISDEQEEKQEQTEVNTTEEENENEDTSIESEKEDVTNSIQENTKETEDVTSSTQEETKEPVGSSTKKEQTTSKESTSKETTKKEQTTTNEVTCTPKKFSNTYTYVYETNETCKKEGNNAFLYVSDNINSDVFAYDCEQITDECGTTYYGVFFYIYENGEKKVYY